MKIDLEELAQVLKLYNNPSGAHTIEFAKMTGDIYNNDKVRFIKALHLDWKMYSRIKI